MLNHHVTPYDVLWLISIGLQTFLALGAIHTYREQPVFRAYCFYIAVISCDIVLLYFSGEAYTQLFQVKTALSFVTRAAILSELWQKSLKGALVGVPAGILVVWSGFNPNVKSTLWFVYCSILVLFLIYGKPDKRRKAIATGFVVSDLFPAIADLAMERTRFLAYMPTLAYVAAQCIWIWGMFPTSESSERQSRFPFELPQ